MCFGGMLAPLPVHISRARTFLGAVQYKKKRMPDGRWHYSEFVFKISSLIDRPQETVDDTILHEMIHYHILSSQLQDTSPHGRLFMRKMNEINRKFNRHITVSHHSTREEHDLDDQKRQHLVCLMHLRDGRRGILMAARTRLFELWDKVAREHSVTEWKWFSTTDAWFNRFPRSQTLRFYTPPYEEIEAHLKEARPLHRDGNRIFVGKPAGK